jgi:ATP-binding cassette, subfamily B (MDR/TAP), member 1
MNYALGFWFGAKLVSEKTFNTNSGTNYIAADVIVIFFTLYLSNLSLSGLPESFASFNVSRMSMKKILNIIDRQSRVLEGNFAMPEKIDEI